jgi:hypothetical protein
MRHDPDMDRHASALIDVHFEKERYRRHCREVDRQP